MKHKHLMPNHLRYFVFYFCVLLLFVSLFSMLIMQGKWATTGVLVFGFLSCVGLWDINQRQHSILRNYPILGHLRFIQEFIRPEIRQYFIEDDLEAQPFSRVQRSLVYQRAKNQVDVRPFGTQLDVGANGYEWVNHSMLPSRLSSHDFRVWVGGRPGAPAPGVSPATQPYHASVCNISAMSFGALSANAIMAMNMGAKMANFAHNTGEGGISKYHRKHGGDLVWQIGSGYFGCRNDDGTFNPDTFAAQAQDPQVKMIELKISQGAKPGHGGILPGAKVSAEVAEARHVPEGVDCISPWAHSAFSTPVGMLRFVAQLRELSGGKPVGIKICIGHPWEWFAMVKAMLETDITPDFITVDGGEGGTGAAPVEFSDHVGTPAQEGLRLVNDTLVGVGLRERIRIGSAGKVIHAFDMMRMFALGADWCNSGRAYMMAVGCIQAQICHTGFCPTGVTTQDPKRQSALVVTDKGPRVANYHENTLAALRELLQAAGLSHPSEVTTHHIVRRIRDSKVQLLSQLLPDMKPGAILDNLSHLPNVYRLYWPLADAHSFNPRLPAADEAPLDMREGMHAGQKIGTTTAYDFAEQLLAAKRRDAFRQEQKAELEAQT